MRKVDIIIFPFHDYKKWINEGFRTRDAHLFEYIKEHKNIGKILVINRPVSIAEILLKRKSWKISSSYIKSKSFNYQLAEIGNDVFVLDTFIPHFFRVVKERKAWWNTSFKNKKIIDIINKSTESIGMDNICLLIQTPMAAGVIGKLNENIVAFDAIDNWLHHPQMQKYKDIIYENYSLIENNADIIFTVSDDLKKMFNKNNNVHWISNGVDIEYFKPGVKVYKDNTNVKIGYVGKIQDRIDFNLVEKCLMKFPNCEFIFCGPILSCKSKVNNLIDKYKNIKFVGDIHYDELPNKMNEFDIAIIPHKVDKFTNSMNPLKLYEYISAGKQVISTEVAGINNISQYVYSSSNYEEFLNNIEKSINNLKKNGNMMHNVVKSLDEKYTWKNKTDEIIKNICSLI